MKKKLLLSALLMSTLILSGSAYGSTRIVIEPSESKSIISETISNIVSTNHGNAVFNAGNLTVSDTTFDSNKGVSNYVLGGALFNKGTATVTDSIFTNNKSSFGAAIYNQSRLTIENSKFINNEIHYHNDAWSSGAAIDNNDGCAVVLNVINSYFEGNKNSSLNGGGAIYFGTTSSEQSKIISSTFINNDSRYRGTVTAEKVGRGGAINLAYGNLLVEDSTFQDNKADIGGAIYNHGDALDPSNAHELEIKGGSFEGNYATVNGGAIFNAANATINGSEFTGNKSDGNGGAIFANGADSSAITEIIGSTFTGNTAANGYGGAAYVTNSTMKIESSDFNNNSALYAGALTSGTNNSNLVINNSNFTGNSAEWIGAVGVFKKAEITNSKFENNSATSATGEGGGAMFVGSEGAIANLDNVIFKGNTSASSGGAIGTRVAENDNGSKNNNSNAVLNISNSTFENNTAATTGGAIDNHFYNDANGISNSTFKNNSAKDGGAIYNHGDTDNQGKAANLKIDGGSFEGNSATGNGGAIYNAADATIKDASFTNNTASEKGGAIFATGNVDIIADKSDILFSGNNAGDGGDIYMQKADGKAMGELSIDTGDIDDERFVTFESGISGSEKFNMNVNGDGDLVLNSYLRNANMTVDGAALALGNRSDIDASNSIKLQNDAGLSTVNNKIDNLPENIFTIDGEIGLAADVDLATGKGDNIGAALNENESNGTFRLDSVVTSGNTTESNISMDLYKALGLNRNQLTIDSEVYAPNVLTPIRYLKGSVDENGMLTYAPTGNSYKDFNPSVMVGAVAAQAGGYLTQLNTYNQAFMNLDMKMLMTSEERAVMRMRNRYASTERPQVFSPTYLPEEHKAMWVRPYSSFESVNMGGGPKVSNVAYGTFFGGDSELYEFKNGALAQLSAYAGYNGSHQAYTGNSIYQNGGTIGLTGIIYKNNFFTALTANTGASVANASTMYGSEDIPMLMAGVASKTGYNWELAKGKFIIQPSYMMSYTFVNTFDYTNAAGVRIDSSPLHAIQIAPGIKLIGNLKNGWQPYINLRMVWNIMDQTNFTAANTSLPDLSVKPYFEYGVGVQKRWGERFTGFGQAMLKAGGINGVSLGFGFRWTLGKAPSTSTANQKPKNIVQTTSLKLSNVK